MESVRDCRRIVATGFIMGEPWLASRNVSSARRLLTGELEELMWVYRDCVSRFPCCQEHKLPTEHVEKSVDISGH